jgi:hypothetical protein
MAENYILLERTELNTTAASVTFANIPQTGYTDLKIVVSARYASGSGFALIDFNNLSTANFSNRVLEGTGSSAISFVAGNTNYAGGIVGAGDTANTFSNAEIYIPNYLSGVAKSYSIDAVTENNGTTAYADMVAGLWNNTAAINAVRLSTHSGAGFAANSTFSLYGIAALGTTPVIAPKASGGNRIDNDGTYWYHTFTSSGSFTPIQGITADVLVIAGGAGGGYWSGGGGGAGGLVYSSAQSLASATTYSCTIGAGGTAGTGSGNNGGNGVNSSFASIVATGGGGGASDNGVGTQNGVAGASGGGGLGGYNSSGGAASPSGQGFPGGGGATGAPVPGGGGGGSAEAGGTDTQGFGGDGLATYSSWGLATNTGQNISGTVYYAGGGGGGTGAGTTLKVGGDGGGGNGGYGYGGTVLNPTAGTANTGGGGGGGTSVAVGATGGSGIVIIRYTIA